MRDGCLCKGDWRCDFLMISGIICSFIGTIAFSHLFSVPKKHYLNCGIVGAVGYACYWILDKYVTAAMATFVATMVVVLFSRILTVLRKCPITVFLISGIFPLVPGSYVYNAAYYIVMNNLTEAAAWGINALKLSFAIVVGIVFVVSLPRKFFTTGYWQFRRDKKKVVSK